MSDIVFFEPRNTRDAKKMFKILSITAVII